jgi:DNA-binding CsgD family transcriptional regulator
VLPAAAISAGELGLLDEARDILRKATAAYGGRPFWMATWQCNWAEGFLMARAGQAEKAVLRLDEAASGLLKVGARSPAAFVLADLAEVAARASMAGVAAQAAARLRSIGVRLRAPLYEAVAGVAASWAALAAGDQAAAAKEAALACGLLVDAGYDALYGRALEVRGLALLESDRARATDVLQQAAEIFSGCQANWRREQVEEALSRLGQRRRRGASGRAGPGALSPRERQVAALAAQAYTAREIGARLGIGMRTVETHLDNAYAKLGIASKAELVRNAAELGLQPHLARS